MDEIAALAEPLKDLRVLHLSATAFGGGVAEILYTLVPLMQDAGLDTEWRIIHGEDEFFDVTKAIHNGLQGHETALTEEQKEIFRRYTKLNADALEGEFDVVIVHDAQPVGLIDEARDHCKHWIFRCHIDLSEPNRDVLDFLTPWISQYDASVYHRRDYVPDGLDLAARVHLAAGDRSAGAEEHGAVARGRVVHRRPVRDRREPPADHAGLPLRPVEGPARRDRRLADRAREAPRRAARARRLDGA